MTFLCSIVQLTNYGFLLLLYRNSWGSNILVFLLMAQYYHKSTLTAADFLDPMQCAAKCSLKKNIRNDLVLRNSFISLLFHTDHPISLS